MSQKQKLQAPVCPVNWAKPVFSGSFHSNSREQRMLLSPTHENGSVPTIHSQTSPREWGLLAWAACMSTAGDAHMLSEHLSSKCWGEMPPYPNGTESMAWDLFFPDLFLWVAGGEGREEGTWQQINPSSIWEAAERSAGPEGKDFEQELQ